MSRVIPTPHQLLEPVRRLLAPSSPAGRDRSGRTTEERILDAALATFTAHGVKATTMAAVAREAGISREWLYKQFANRDALVMAVTRREALEFVDGLAVRGAETADFTEAVTDVFVYAVEFLRDHALLQRVLTAETEVLSARMLGGVAPLLRQVVEVATAYLAALGSLAPDRAAILAETMVRLIATTVAAPVGVLDLHDPTALRAYAEVMVPAFVEAVR